MKILKIMIIVLILIISAGAVYAADSLSDEDMVKGDNEILESVQDDVIVLDLENNHEYISESNESSFKDLENDIKDSNDFFNVTRNYKFNDQTDNVNGIAITKDNLVINGNGFTVDADEKSMIFNLTGSNITINNLNIINAKSSGTGAILIGSTSSLKTNNVTFENNSVGRGTVYVQGHYTSVNDRFINNQARASAVYGSGEKSSIEVINGTFISDNELSWGLIYAYYSNHLYIENTTFANMISNYSTAIYVLGSSGKIKNCDFINLTAKITAGAIGIRASGGDMTIENCNFINTTSQKNGGAVFADVAGPKGGNDLVNISNCQFINCSSEFGGAFIQLGGRLSMEKSNFTSNNVEYDGGAVYLSGVEGDIINSRFISNHALCDGFANGGACYLDNGEIKLDSCIFKNNTASEASSIYTYDFTLTLKDSYFNNPGNCSSIFCVNAFDNIFEDGNNFTNDAVSLNNTNYDLTVENSQTTFTLLNNSIYVETLPSRFDLRDWGWVSPVKDQGARGSCWAFGSIAALESAIIRYANITYLFSENNLQNTMLTYSKYGRYSANESGNSLMAMGYFIGWLGISPVEYDTYDQLGKITQLIATDYDIHVMDAVMIPARKNSTDNDQLKWALLKYGSLAVNYLNRRSPDFYNEETHSYYSPDSGHNHAVSLVGWDDNYPKENFAQTPDGDGAWICKNSWGTDWGEDGFFYISYYDASFVRENPAMAFIIENIDFNKIYQLETCYRGILNDTYYMNCFVAKEDALIGAVGTYFNSSNVNYEFSVFVNGVNVHNQSGINNHMGYLSIRLDKYIPVKKGDEFIVKFKNNSTAIGSARMDVEPQTSYLSYDGENWEDASKYGYAAILKAYTLIDDTRIIGNSDMLTYYGSSECFTVKVVFGDGHAVGLGAVVNFTINGKTTSVITDDDGVAKIEITEVPGIYEMVIGYNNQTYKNNVTVVLNALSCKITQNTDITVDYDGGKYFTVKLVSSDGKLPAAGLSVIFNINGKSITAITDNNGIAKIKIMDVPHKYTITTTFNGKSVKNTVTVKQVLKAKKVTVKKTSKKLFLKATLKINGKLQKGKQIIFNFNGKTYKVKTNKKGIAQKKLNKKVIKKLRKGKTYTVKVTYLKDTIKTTVKVK